MPGRKIDSKLAVWLLIPGDVLMVLCRMVEENSQCQLTKVDTVYNFAKC